MMQTVRKAVFVFALGFLTLFILRLGFGYYQWPNGRPIAGSGFGASIASGWEFATDVRNYASSKFKKTSVAATQSGGDGGGADQKYEKVANIGLRSKEFDKHETGIRGLIKSSSALIQFEQRRGLKGRRVLRLAIGVVPSDFDDFVAKAQLFGKLTELTINKSDKTNEYRELKAKRLSLEKTREGMLQLKQREGKIPDMIALENQILNLEQQIQSFGVSLGDFDAENEFVTVKILLAETRAAVLRNLSFLKRTFTAFVWTVKYYALLWFGLACAVIGILAAVQLLRIFANALPKPGANSE